MERSLMILNLTFIFSYQAIFTITSDQSGILEKMVGTNLEFTSPTAKLDPFP